MHFRFPLSRGGPGGDHRTVVRSNQATLGQVLQVIFQRLQECESAESCLEFIGALLGLNELITIPLGAENQEVRQVLASFLSQPDRLKQVDVEDPLKSGANGDAEAAETSDHGVPPAVVTVGQQPAPGPPQPETPEPPKSAEEQMANNHEAKAKGTCLSARYSAAVLNIQGVFKPPSYASKVTTSMNELLALPLFPPASEGGPLRRCFVFLEEPAKSLGGRLISFILTLIICISTAAFVMESMPEFRARPAECARLRTAGLPLTAEACEPMPDEAFQDVEVFCICVFTVDYVLRVLTVAAGCSKAWQGLKCTLIYLLQPLNAIDFLAILPSYIQWAVGTGGLGMVRVLRLARILRILKLAKRNQGMQLIARVIERSGRPLGILLFYNVLIVLVFGSLMHFAEGQRFSVAPEFTQPHNDSATNRMMEPPFPTGVYVRSTVSLQGDEVTPFRSIPYSVWYVCVTLTTVGYGDYSPTTYLGKAIGVACFYTGVLFIALPFSVVSSNFEIVYESHRGDQDRRAELLKRKKEKLRLSFLRQSEGDNARTFWNVPWTPAATTLRRKIFFVLEQPSASRLGRLISILMMLTILMVTASFIMESMPEFNDTPSACQEKLTVANCQPRPLPIFATLEVVGIAIFTVEYLLRVLTVHVADPDECGLADHYYSPPRKTLAYCRQWMNIIDVLAIAPFYFELAMGEGARGASTSVLRVFRLVRVFRLLRMPKLSTGVSMFSNIVADSLPALFLLFSLTLIGCVFFASCLTFAEGSWYSVDHFREEFPEGLYIRPTKDGHGVEPSPFRSILYTFWWFFTTATTVGYGDDYPTTTAGRIIGVLAAYVGILLIALPVTIVGDSFSKYYSDWVEGMQEHEKAVGQQMSGESRD